MSVLTREILNEAINKLKQNDVQQTNLQIVPNRFIPEFTREQFRFPRCKSKRIGKKWGKNPQNFRNIRQAIIFNDTAYVHPNTFAKIKETLK